MFFNTKLMQAVSKQKQRRTLLSDGERLHLDTQAVCEAVETLTSVLENLGTYGIAVAMDNGPAWVLTDLAALECGLWTLPLPPFFTTDQCANALQRSGCTFVISDRPPQQGTLLNSFELAGQTLYIASLSERQCADLTHEHTAKVTFTSGSTGDPKGICLSLEQMINTAEAVAERIAALEIERHVSILPLAVLLENVAGVYAALLAGVTCIVPSLANTGLAEQSPNDRKTLLKCLQEQRANSCILVPELLKVICQSITSEPDLRLSEMKFIAVGGAPVGQDLLQQCTSLQLPVYEGYGLSEACSVVALNTPGTEKTGSVGQLLSHQKIHVAHDGEVFLEAAAFLGYCGEEPIGNEPFETGDIGMLDAAGYLHIQGRKKNTLITNMGRNVAPEWLESELTGSGSIHQAFVHCDDANQISALIVSSADDAAVDTAMHQTNSYLPDYATIQQWVRVPAFTPAQGTLTGNGKLKRAAIQQRHERIQSYNSLEPTGDRPCSVS